MLGARNGSFPGHQLLAACAGSGRQGCRYHSVLPKPLSSGVQNKGPEGPGLKYRHVCTWKSVASWGRGFGPSVVGFRVMKAPSPLDAQNHWGLEETAATKRLEIAGGRKGGRDPPRSMSRCRGTSAMEQLQVWVKHPVECCLVLPHSLERVASCTFLKSVIPTTGGTCDSGVQGFRVQCLRTLNPWNPKPIVWRSQSSWCCEKKQQGDALHTKAGWRPYETGEKHQPSEKPPLCSCKICCAKS